MAVLPSGTAEKTLRLAGYARQLSDAAAAGRQAMRDKNAAAIEAARAQLLSLQTNVDYSPRIFAVNNVLAPPNGIPVTVAQVAARFPAAPDDARFAQGLASLVAQLKLIRQTIADRFEKIERPIQSAAPRRGCVNSEFLVRHSRHSDMRGSRR